MITQSNNKTDFVVFVIQKIVLRFYALFIWCEGNVGQNFAISICMLYLLRSDHFHNNQTQHSNIRIYCTNVFRITYTYRKTL